MEICEQYNTTWGVALFIHISFFFIVFSLAKRTIYASLCLTLTTHLFLLLPSSSSSRLFLLLSSSSSSLVGDSFEELGLEAIEMGDERDWA
jgi:hypothetical protein